MEQGRVGPGVKRLSYETPHPPPLDHPRLGLDGDDA